MSLIILAINILPLYWFCEKMYSENLIGLN